MFVPFSNFQPYFTYTMMPGNEEARKQSIWLQKYFIDDNMQLKGMVWKFLIFNFLKSIWQNWVGVLPRSKIVWVFAKTFFIYLSGNRYCVSVIIYLKNIGIILLFLFLKKFFDPFSVVSWLVSWWLGYSEVQRSFENLNNFDSINFHNIF